MESFRISVRSDIHQQVKRKVMSLRESSQSVGKVISEVVGDWLKVDAPDLPVPDDPQGLARDRKQCVFKLDPELVPLYLHAVDQRLVRVPERRDGCRIDRHEIDTLLTRWLEQGSSNA